MTGRRANAGRGRARATAADRSQPQGTSVRGARGRRTPVDLGVGELHRARLEEEDEMRDGESAALNESDVTPVPVDDDDHTEGYDEEVIKGSPTPKASIALWPSWRTKFFKDWRDGPRPDGDVTKPRPVWGICTLCNNGKQLAGNLKAFTNFANHMKTVHTDEWEAFMNPKSSDGTTQSKIPNFTTSSKMTSARQEKLDAGLTRVFCEVPSLPLRLLRTQVFRDWIQLAIPGYKLPSVHAMRYKHIPRLNALTANAVKQKISTCRTVNIILDIWSSKNMAGFIAFNLQGVTEDFEMFTCLLSVRQMFGRHTGEAILAEFEDVLREWGISIKSVSRVVTDSGANMIRGFNLRFPSFVVHDFPVEETGDQSEAEAAVSSQDEDMVEIEIESDASNPLWQALQDADFQSMLLNEDDDDDEEMAAIERDLASSYMGVQRESEEEVADDQRYLLKSSMRTSCCAHNLNLVVKNGLNSIEGAPAEAVKRMSGIIGSVRHSVLDTEEVVKTTHFRLINKNDTRWNSQLYSMQSFVRALDIDPTLQNRLNATTKKHRKLTSVELNILKELILLLQPFEEASDDYQADYESTGSVIPAYLDLVNKVTLTIKTASGAVLPNPLSPFTGKVTHCKAVATALQDALQTRMAYVMNDAVYVLAAVLDPRFKLDWVSSSGQKEKDVLDAVKAELELRYRNMKESDVIGTEAVVTVTDVTQTTSDGASSPMEDTDTQGKKRKARSLFSTVLKQRRPPSTGPAKVLEEIEVFLSEATCGMDCLEDPANPKSKRIPVRPLQYWKVNNHRFPYLAQIAKDIFGTPASSGSVERVFSTATDIMTAKRNRMKADLFSMLMFIKRNSHLMKQRGVKC